MDCDPSNPSSPPAEGKLSLDRWRMPKRFARGIAPAIVGLVLIASALLKCHDLAAAGTISHIRLSGWITILAVPLELFLGAWLISGVFARRARIAGAACFALLAAVSLAKALEGQSSCGCFGAIEVNPWWSFAFDMGAMAALMCSLRDPTGDGVTRWGSRRHAFALGGTMLAVVFVAALTHFAMSAVGEEVVVLEPTEWLGQRFPLFDSIDIGPAISEGDWIVVLVQEGCSNCREAGARYERLARRFSKSGQPTRIALIRIPPFSANMSGNAGECATGRLDGGRFWFVVTPTEITLRDGIVQKIGQCDAG